MLANSASFRMNMLLKDPPPTDIYTLSLHDALPIQASLPDPLPASEIRCDTVWVPMRDRSEEHTAELQSRQYLVCRLLLGKKKNRQKCMGAEPPRPGGVDHTRHERPSSLTQHRPPSR